MKCVAPLETKAVIPLGGQTDRREGCSLGKAERIPDFVEAVNQRVIETCVHCKKTWHVLAVVRFVYSHFGLTVDEKSNDSLVSEFGLLHRLAEKKLLMSYLKFKCAASFAWYLQDEMPALSAELMTEGVRSTPYWAGGRYYSFTVAERSRNNTQLFYSLLMMKKGFPRPDEEEVKAAEIAACATMTTPASPSLRRDIAIDVVGERASRIIKKVFRRVDWDSELPSWWSMSGHYDAKSSEGGALQVLRDLGFAPDPREFDLTRWYDGWSEEAIEDEDHPQYALCSHAQAELRRVQKNLVQAGLEEVSRCKPVGLPEPLKIRIVTVGPVCRYAACGVIQKRIWQQLKSDKRFAIGAPISGEGLHSVLGRLQNGAKWLSGDYKAATDNLAIELSEHIANQIATAMDMPWEYRRLFVDALVAHEYEMPDGTFRPQARGQLMGSPVSFPVLCIANAALIEEVLDNDVTYMVNGDDCVFQCTDAQRLAWVELATLIGLQPSVGKTYHHGKYLVMNSTLFIDDGVGVFTELPYLNLGLLIGMKRSGGDKSKDVVASRKNGWTVDMGVGGRARAYVKGWGDRASAMLSTFIHANREWLDQNGSQSWFVPEEWGGAGLPETGHELHRPSLQDMQAVIRSDTARVPKPKAVLDLCSPFYTAVQRRLIDRYGGVWERNSKFVAGSYQWVAMKETSVPRQTRWEAVRDSRRASQRVRNYWAGAFKAGGDASKIVRDWFDGQEFDTEGATLEGMTRQYYDRLLAVGPMSEVPAMALRSEFLDRYSGADGGCLGFSCGYDANRVRNRGGGQGLLPALQGMVQAWSVFNWESEGAWHVLPGTKLD